jgi:hypothetical protein
VQDGAKLEPVTMHRDPDGIGVRLQAAIAEAPPFVSHGAAGRLAPCS